LREPHVSLGPASHLRQVASRCDATSSADRRFAREPPRRSARSFSEGGSRTPRTVL
jgi:hypothetical protein